MSKLDQSQRSIQDLFEEDPSDLCSILFTVAMLPSRDHGVAVFCSMVVLTYAWPLLSTRHFGDWDFLYIWDDRTNYVNNRVLQSALSLETLYAMFTMVRLNVYEPLGWMLKYLIVKTVGLDAWWVRVVSVAIHFAAGFVLARASAVLLDVDYVLTELRGSRGRAGLELQKRRRGSRLHFHACCMSAVAFMIHPIHVEVVGWPSAQPYTLAALFSSWALLVHVQNIYHNLEQLIGGGNGDNLDKDLVLKVLLGRDATTKALISSGLYLCALLSKSASLMLPTGFILLDAWVYLQLPPQQRKLNAVELIPYAIRRLPSVATLLAFVSVTAFSNSEGAVPDVVSLSLIERVLKALASPMWLLRCLLWPSKLRPHYQIRPGDLSVTNPECLLPVMITLTVLASLLWRMSHRAASTHSLALVYFGCMLLPVSGLIRHGITTGGADRYAYLSTIVAVPYGGYAVARWLLRGSDIAIENQRRAAPAWDAKVLKSTRHSKQRKNIDITNARHIHTARAYWWAMWLLLTGALLSISTSLLSHWCNEDALYDYSLRTDPADWKIYGQRAEYLLRIKRCGPSNIECRQLWTLAYEFSPRGTLKSELYRLHLLVALGDNDRACDGYSSLLKENPENASVHNNVAVCRAMRGELNEAERHFSLALERPAIEETMAVHVKNKQDFLQWKAMRLNRDTGAGFIGAMTY